MRSRSVQRETSITDQITYLSIAILVAGIGLTYSSQIISSMSSVTSSVNVVISIGQGSLVTTLMYLIGSMGIGLFILIKLLGE